MSPTKYVIVGTEVDQAEYFLHPDGKIDRKKGSDGKPLTVEFIGKLMVRLSKLGKAGVPAAELKKYEDQVRHAMMVQDFSVSEGSAPLSDAERDAILAGTEVQIQFETRKHNGASDHNKRILVVPSDETLEVSEAILKANAPREGFRPPLSYELDHALMLASFQDEILQLIANFPGHAGWTPQLRKALEQHIQQGIEDMTTVKTANGQAAKDVKNEIMKSPVRAFYRSVGIYATNMCR